MFDPSVVLYAGQVVMLVNNYFEVYSASLLVFLDFEYELSWNLYFSNLLLLLFESTFSIVLIAIHQCHVHTCEFSLKSDKLLHP